MQPSNAFVRDGSGSISFFPEQGWLNWGDLDFLIEIKTELANNG